MDWWPRQTPRMGTAPLSDRMRGTEMPASAGVQGPGLRTTASGFIARTSSTEISSFRWTSTSAPSDWNACTRLKVNES